MGNSELSCLRQQRVNNGEFEFKKVDTVLDDEYRTKITSDELLKVLISEKSRPPQQARTYDKGSVRVSVF